MAINVDPSLLRLLPIGQYEFVDVSFVAAAQDTTIPYSIIKPEDVGSVRWIDVTPNAVFAGSDTVGHVYCSRDPARKPFGTGYIVLRANVAGYATRLLLFVERTTS